MGTFGGVLVWSALSYSQSGAAMLAKHRLSEQQVKLYDFLLRTPAAYFLRYQRSVIDPNEVDSRQREILAISKYSQYT